jgi:LysR family transcriptional activator of glutamate synthase operon
LDLLQMRYFQHIAYTENITRSANELLISQPALSKMLNNLEKELGAKLFDRRGRHIELNSKGTLFLKRVETILNELEEARKEILDYAGEINGNVRFCFDVASHIIPNLLRDFCLIYPKVTFQLLQHYRNPSSSKFDLCVTSLPTGLHGTEKMELLREEILLAVPKSHPLSSLSTINLSDLSSESLISLKKGNSLRESTDALCKIAGFIPRITFESDDPATVRGLIRAGQGIAFVPALTWKGTTDESIALLEITNPSCFRTIELHWKEGRYLSPTVQTFRQFILDYFSKL